MARQKKGLPVHGWLFLDKPPGLGSTQAVSMVRRLFDARKAGHAGTLDPLATGLLGVALGEATKTVPWMMNADKTYTFTIKWGEATSTGDADERGQVVATSDVRPVREQILDVLLAFTGEVEQVPPAYSAIKIDGKRAYDLARAGQEVEIKPRLVHIYRLSLTDMPDRDHASFEVVCSKGTYVRSLGRDIALALGSQGHLSALRRTQSGGISIDQAMTPDQLEAAAGDHLADCLHPVDAVLAHLPHIQLDAGQAQRISHGNPVLLTPAQISGAQGDLLLMSASKPLAIASLQGLEAVPQRVFNL